MSTSSTYVKWAAVTLDFAIFSKMRFLSPWIGIRCSLPLGATAAAGGGATTVVLVGPWGALGRPPPWSRPSGPLPRTARDLRSVSLRGGGPRGPRGHSRLERAPGAGPFLPGAVGGG